MKNIIIILFLFPFLSMAQDTLYGYRYNTKTQSDSVVSALNKWKGIPHDAYSTTQTWTVSAQDSAGNWFVPFDSTLYNFIKAQPTIITITSKP